MFFSGLIQKILTKCNYIVYLYKLQKEVFWNQEMKDL